MAFSLVLCLQWCRQSVSCVDNDRKIAVYSVFCDELSLACDKPMPKHWDLPREQHPGLILLVFV